MSRKIKGSQQVIVEAVDQPGHGGAHHEYFVAPISQDAVNPRIINAFTVHFQNGPIQEVGVNGCQQEDLLLVVIDRLQSFQAGPFACRENAIALTKCQEAVMWLQKRTHDRRSRGVEGLDVI